MQLYGPAYYAFILSIMLCCSVHKFHLAIFYTDVKDLCLGIATVATLL